MAITAVIKKFSLTLSMLVAMLGLLVIVGWHLHSTLLIQVYPDFLPMQYNTALGFIFSGLAIIALQSSRIRLAQIFSVTVLLIGGLTLWQIVTGLNLHIDQLFMQHYVVVKTDTPGRMAPNTALCFLLSGFTVLVFTLPLSAKVKGLVHDILPSAIVALALMALAGYILGLESAYGWGNLSRMAVHSSAGFFVLGLALFLLPVPGQKINVLPIVGLTLLALMLTLWQLLITSELAIKQGQVQQRAEQFRNALAINLKIETKAWQRMADRWEQHGGTPRLAWQSDALAYLSDREYLVVARYAADTQSIWMVRSEHVNASRVIEALPQNMCQTAASAPLKLISDPQLGALLIDVTPLRKAGRSDGCVVAITSLNREIDDARATISAKQFPLTILQAGDDRPVFSEASNGVWHAEAKLQEAGLNLIVRLIPTQQQLASGVLPTIVPIVGIALITLVLLSLYWPKTARKNAIVARGYQNRLQLESELRHQAIEMAPHAMVLVDQNGVIELINLQTEKIFGYARADLLGQSIDILLPERFRDQHPHHRGLFFKTPGSRAMGSGRDLYARRQDGTEFPVEVGLAPLPTPETGVIKVLASIVDISERKRSERLLLRSNQRFAMASEAAGLGFWGWNITTNTLEWDDEMFRLYGRQRTDGDLPYALWANNLHPDDRVMSEQILNDAVKGIRVFDTKFRILLPDGTIRHIQANASVTRDAEGNALEMFGINMDITKRILHEQRLIESAHELARINEELDHFAYVASHDLKSPLRGIDQLATWIAEDMGEALNSNTQEHLRLMRSRIKRMEMLLDDLLAYSRVGRADDAIVQVNTRELVANIFDLAADSEIHLILAENMPTLQTKKVPLELVFRNLIGNAIKHHHKTQGTITISARQIADGFEFEVSDDGPGIPPEHQQRVFAMFQTLKPRDEIEGSGIGLALVKKAVETMGGRIMLESDGQHGSTFRFTWPTINHEGEVA